MQSGLVHTVLRLSRFLRDFQIGRECTQVSPNIGFLTFVRPEGGRGGAARQREAEAEQHGTAAEAEQRGGGRPRRSSTARWPRRSSAAQSAAVEERAAGARRRSMYGGRARGCTAAEHAQQGGGARGGRGEGARAASGRRDRNKENGGRTAHIDAKDLWSRFQPRTGTKDPLIAVGNTNRDQRSVRAAKYCARSAQRSFGPGWC